MAVYLYMVGGKSMYELLHANLEGALPSPSYVVILTRKHSAPILEGELRMENLRTHLDERALPRFVWLSEDGTRITGRVEYDAATDRCVGFPPPLDQRSGMPITSGFAASSAEAIQALFTNCRPAKNAYVVLAQPLQKHAAAFSVLMFGTDNKFTAQDVVHRWRFMAHKAARNNITVLGFSSDGGECTLSPPHLSTSVLCTC